MTRIDTLTSEQEASWIYAEFIILGAMLVDCTQISRISRAFRFYRWILLEHSEVFDAIVYTYEHIDVKVPVNLVRDILSQWGMWNTVVTEYDLMCLLDAPDDSESVQQAVADLVNYEQALRL